MVANLANTIAFFIFTSVNIAVVYKYHKEKREQKEQALNNSSDNNQDEKEKLEPLLQKFKDAYPIYGIIGAICTSVIFIKSPQFYKIK